MSFCRLEKPRQSSPAWSEERVIVLCAEDPDGLTNQINSVLRNPSVYVLAISAASVIATYVDDPWTSTLVYQERIDPLSGDAS